MNTSETILQVTKNDARLSTDNRVFSRIMKRTGFILYGLALNRAVAFTITVHSPTALSTNFHRVTNTSLIRLSGKRGNGKVKKEQSIKKNNLPEKICVVCQRPFSWRKKWERCWDEVQCCSKACNSKRRGGRIQED